MIREIAGPESICDIVSRRCVGWSRIGPNLPASMRLSVGSQARTRPRMATSSHKIVRLPIIGASITCKEHVSGLTSFAVRDKQKGGRTRKGQQKESGKRGKR
jgi:hypothetical protein